MSEITLSIVCPVYNCAAFLDDLVGAIVLNGNDPSMEWIFVHDCATDDSEQVLKSALELRAAELHCRVIHVKHAINRGVSAARNTGIDKAAGRYVGFFDSDDVPMAGYAKEILAALSACEPQILEVGYREFFETRDLEQPPVPVPALQHFGQGTHFRLLFKNNFFSWTRIVRRELLDRVRFAENGKAYEDIPYTLEIFCEAGSVTYLDKPLVGYRKRAGSITSIRDARFYDQYSQLVAGVHYYRSHPAVVKTSDFEWRLLRKVCIIFLKALRISSTSARRNFFMGVLADLGQPVTPFTKPVNRAAKVFAKALSISVMVLPKAT